MISKNDIYIVLRKLAKQMEYQTIYGQEKLRIKLFMNDIDLSDIQLNFIEYLSFYNILFMDLALGEISEIVFDNDIYEDAYIYFKRYSKTNTDYKPIKDKIDETNIKTKTQWVFKS